MTPLTTPAPDPATDKPLAIEHAAGVRLLKLLRESGYRFITPSPATHRLVLKHPQNQLARDVCGALGWSLPFTADTVPVEVFETLEAAGGLEPHPLGYKARIRVSSLGDDLFIHSAYPTSAPDAVFFGPDTYRFARLLRAVLTDADKVEHLVDIGVGSAAGAVAAARACQPSTLTVTDVNPKALAAARINLEAAGLQAEFRLGPGIEALKGLADLIIANPPFIAGDGDRTYRDGGDMLGARLSLDWASQGAERLTPGGRFVLYTGSAIVDGRDALREALVSGLDPSRFELSYEELDPDIFGGQLASKAYEGVDRIAAIGAVIHRLG